MKRFLLTVFCLCFLFSCTSAENLGIDFDTLTTEELQYIYDEVSVRLQAADQGPKEVIVPQGTYVVGQDLPAGSYYVKCNDASPNAFGYTMNIETGEYVESLYFVADMMNETVVHLHDGETLALYSVAENAEQSTFTITQLPGLFK